MKPRTLTAVTTCLAFAAAMLWPYVVRAQGQPAPAPAPGAAAPAGDDALNQAKQHFEAGKNAYNAGDYQSAIREFKAAEALRPSPILDYNIGLANEKLNKKRVAVKYYKRYLDGMPNASNRAEVEGNIARLEREIAAAPPPTQNTPPAQVEQPSDMPPPVAPQTQQPGYSSYDPYAATPAPYNVQPTHPPKKKSYWWVALIVVGGALLLTGIIVYAVLVTSTVSTSTFDHALTSPGREPPRDATQRSPGLGNTVFTF